MRVYKNTKVHLIFGLVAILLIVWLSDLAGLWSTKVSTVMTLLTLVLTGAAYYVTRKIPKHDDNIHFHKEDEHMHVRH